MLQDDIQREFTALMVEKQKKERLENEQREAAIKARQLHAFKLIPDHPARSFQLSLGPSNFLQPTSPQQKI